MWNDISTDPYNKGYNSVYMVTYNTRLLYLVLLYDLVKVFKNVIYQGNFFSSTLNYITWYIGFMTKAGKTVTKQEKLSG